MKVMRMKIYHKDMGLWRNSWIQGMTPDQVRAYEARGGCAIEIPDDDYYGTTLPDTLKDITYDALKGIMAE